MSTVPGLDVSYWQAEVDWKRVSATGVRFAFVKATEGVAYTDSTFVRNWEGAGANGILRGAYGFYHPNQGARQQADRFVKALRERADEPELPCAIDLEVTDGVPARKIIAGVKVWLEEVTQALGRRPMIYSGVSFLETHLSELGQPPDWTREYDLWLGWFPPQYIPGMSPLLPRGWSGWTFWQYSGEGSIAGIDVPVDLDVFNGTAEQLMQFADADAPARIPKIHIVSAGDTADSIAEEYAISVAELIASNPQLIKPGERLTIPAQSPHSSDPVRTHTVAAGDNLDRIARQYGTTIAALVARNNIKNPDLIEVGQVLVIA